MKKRILFLAAAIFVIVLGTGVLIANKQPLLLSDFRIPAPLWNGLKDAELKLFTSQTTFKGSIGRIDRSFRKISLSQPQSGTVWFTIDAKVQKKWRDGTIYEGDLVTIEAKQYYRPDRSGIEWRIRSIELDSSAFRRPRPTWEPSDFTEPLELSITAGASRSRISRGSALD